MSSETIRFECRHDDMTCCACGEPATNWAILDDAASVDESVIKHLICDSENSQCYMIVTYATDVEAQKLTDDRPSWDEYFMMFAEVASTRSTCSRASVGAVIADPRTHRILATGYNGSPPGELHCTQSGCIMEDGHCQRSIHAEINAVAHAAKTGVSIEGADIYIVKRNLTDGPDASKGHEVCRECAKVLRAVNVRIVE